jgi:hypothetical protein
MPMTQLFPFDAVELAPHRRKTRYQEELMEFHRGIAAVGGTAMLLLSGAPVGAQAEHAPCTSGTAAMAPDCRRTCAHIDVGDDG